MGLDSPVGQKLPRGFEDATIIGVVEDFHYYPLQREIEPLVLHMPMSADITSILEIGVRIRGENMPGTLSKLEQAWTSVSGGMPFSYEFLDDELAEQYVAEQRWKRIIEYSSVLSMLTTCLGLFGLTSLAVAKRTREVGIRKVLGASAPRLVTMFIRGFAGLILIANIIAWPIAYVVMNDWLKQFAYRTGIGIHIFVLTGGLVLLVSMLTIIYQATRAALANPVDALKHE
jgi:putative ABC transport system permease protein